ncbi:V-set and immunoglobulin domain-containing protein 1 [Anomaloglossus baeobatrachus]|uniref:V-set and immunoglobulin domain-containing protein 1 n=1 Tax=Anomaloglossus baeobatrachus TaxID=238106 RepID=UPI003F4FE982
MLPPCFRIFVLLWTFIGVVHAVQVTIPISVVNVTVGQAAILPCTYTLSESSTRNLITQWDFIEAVSQDSVTVYAFQNGEGYSMGRFKNRVTASNTTGNVTITISNMQPQDTGVYKCDVTNFPETPGLGQVQLIVQVAPSTPHCSIQGNIVTGHAVKLVCLSEQGMPRPVYTWNRLVNGNLKPIVGGQQQNGVLIIGNMSKFEDGYYQCMASNSLGNATCELDLHTGGEAGIIVAGIIGAVLLAAIIFGVIWFLIAKKKKEKKQSKISELQTISGSGGQPAAEEPARQNLMVAEPPETREYEDMPENVAAANREVEDPAV